MDSTFGTGGMTEMPNFSFCVDEVQASISVLSAKFFTGPIKYNYIRET